MIKAVIIDFDDTLSMTEHACFVMENETLRAMARAPMSREMHVKTWGKPLFEAINERSPGIDVAKFKVTFDLIMKDHLERKNLDVIAPENYTVLKQLANQGKQIMLLTSRTHDELKHMLEPSHLLSSHIEAFYYKENTRYHKPDPRAWCARPRNSKTASQKRATRGAFSRLDLRSRTNRAAISSTVAPRGDSANAWATMADWCDCREMAARKAAGPKLASAFTPTDSPRFAIAQPPG